LIVLFWVGFKIFLSRCGKVLFMVGFRKMFGQRVRSLSFSELKRGTSNKGNDNKKWWLSMLFSVGCYHHIKIADMGDVEAV
jgi:hypothetical protein